MALIKKYPINKIDCPSCNKILLESVKEIAGVIDCSLVDEGNAISIKSENLIDENLLYNKVDENLRKHNLHIHNLVEEVFYFDNVDCPNCAGKIEALIQKLEGVQEASLNFMAKTITVLHKKDQEMFDLVMKQGKMVEQEFALGYDRNNLVTSKNEGAKEIAHHHESNECSIHHHHDECCHEHDHHHDECCHEHEHHHHDECCHEHEHHHHDECCHEHEHHHHDECCHEHHHDESCDQNQSKDNFLKKLVKRIVKNHEYLIFGLAVGLAIGGTILQFMDDLYYVRLGLFIVSYLILARKLIINAFLGFKRLDFFNENTLMLIASIGALAIDEGFEAIMVVLLNSIGDYYKNKATDSSRNAIASLIELENTRVSLKDGRIVDIEDLEIGQDIIIKVGEKVPVDCLLTSNDAVLDMKSLTGESLPVNIAKGEKILSGSINLDHVIELKVDKKYSESTISKVKDLINKANDKKSKSQEFITKFAKIYTPTIIIIAFLAWAIQFFVMKSELNTSLNAIFSILVIGCPCALVISIPLCYFTGIGRASSEGILVKGGNYLEALVDTKEVVFDKTGTLTKGNFKISQINPIAISEEELISIAAHCEIYSNHPIAQAIIERYGQEIKFDGYFEIEEIPGEGVKYTSDHRVILVGNEKLMKRYEIVHDQVNQIGSIVYVSENGKFLGTIVVSDEMKEEAYPLIKWLNEKKISSTMLTGDNELIAKDVASKLGIQNYQSKLLPEDKYQYLEKIINQKTGTIVYVGDGINDSPSLSLADVGISFGYIGSDVAKEASDVVIMNDDVSKIANLIQISKKTHRVMIENIVFILLVKVIAVIIGALGILGSYSILLSIFADVGVSLLAILHTRRIRK